MKAPMLRTQVCLERELAAGLDRVARVRGTSRAELLRTAARRLLAEDREAYERDPIWGIVDLAKGLELPKDAPTDVAERHDHYLAEIRMKKQREEMRAFGKQAR